MNLCSQSFFYIDYSKKSIIVYFVCFKAISNEFCKIKKYKYFLL